MQSWINYWIFIFWLTFLGFVLNPTNFLFLLVFSEITWVVLYCYSILIGVVLDDLNAFTLSFLILGFASVEFSIGLLILLLFKNFNKTLNLSSNDYNWNQHLYNNNLEKNLNVFNWQLK